MGRAGWDVQVETCGWGRRVRAGRRPGLLAPSSRRHPPLWPGFTADPDCCASPAGSEPELCAVVPGKIDDLGDIEIVESKTLDSVIANVFKENALRFNVADSPSFAVMVDQCLLKAPL